MSSFLKIFFVAITLFCLSYQSQGQNFDYDKDYPKILARTKLANDSLYYPTLLQKFLVNDKKLTVYETLALMIGFTGNKYYQPYSYIKTERIIKELNDKEHYKEAINVADSFLKKHPLSQQAIIEKAYSYHKLNQKDSAIFYKEQFGRLMAAMDWSNDGRTPETAMFAIGHHDGQNFVDKYYHADLGKKGTIEDKNGNLCEMLEMKFKKDGKENTVVFFFVIQHAANTLQEKKD